jgi:hypothetical protein
METEELTTYKQEYLEKMLAYFNRPAFVRKSRDSTTFAPLYTKFDPVDEEQPTMYPTFEKFAADNMLSMEELLEWQKEYPEFKRAYKRCALYQKNIFIVNSLHGNYGYSFAKIVAKSSFNIDDKTVESLDTIYPDTINITFTSPGPNAPNQAGTGLYWDDDKNKKRIEEFGYDPVKSEPATEPEQAPEQKPENQTDVMPEPKRPHLPLRHRNEFSRYSGYSNDFWST